ncbi:MAG TPA: type 4a pilus biogenesis protein PilO [Polyangiaceae bacterium]|nr:type 4a pilus biogenesis protein PilO [Polyangiaceae bacterium]
MARADLSLARLPTAAKVGISAAMVALVGAAYYIVFYDDLTTSMAAAKGQEQQLHTQVSDAHKAEFAYQKDLAELTAKQQRQRELNKVLPVDTEYPAFLSAVQNVATVSGVGLTAWSPNPEVTEQFYARVPMRVELVGRFHQLAKFFYGVSQLDRIINMENITLADPKAVGEDVVLRAEGSAVAFRAIEAGAPVPQDKRGAAQGAKP